MLAGDCVELVLVPIEITKNLIFTAFSIDRKIVDLSGCVEFVEHILERDGVDVILLPRFSCLAMWIKWPA